MVLSADDYGISSEISLAIRDLLKNGRLSSTSCLVTSQSAQDDLAFLKSLRLEVDVGLHVVLSERPGFASFGYVATRALLRQLSASQIRTAIFRQLELFEKNYGGWPDFIDGHQHVQQLPIIRTVLLDVCREIGFQGYIRVARLPSRFWTRALRFSPRFAFENWSVATVGRGLSGALAHSRVPRNRYLFGHYPYSSAIPFKDIFRFYVNLAPTEADVFFCHPGPGQDRFDPISRARRECLDFLSSQEFDELIGVSGIRIHRFPKDGVIRREMPAEFGCRRPGHRSTVKSLLAHPGD